MSTRNPNALIETQATFAERIADEVARFGGSWTFIISFGVLTIIYASSNIGLGVKAWDPYPFILLNLFLSMLAAIQAPVIMNAGGWCMRSTRSERGSTASITC
ncbi:MAG: DUF1003 domain-containing protein [Steroidobacteraceae bacterium]